MHCLFAVIVLALSACGSSTPVTPKNHVSPSHGSGSDAVQAEAGAACTASGGSCVGVGDCGPTVGHLGAATCGAAHLACCITPAGSCGGTEDFACCASSAEFRPVCRDGALVCAEGQTRSTGAHCPGM